MLDACAPASSARPPGPARATRHTYSSLSKAKPKQQQPEDEELESASENSAPGQGLDGVPGCRAESVGSARGRSLGARQASAVSAEASAVIAVLRVMPVILPVRKHNDASASRPRDSSGSPDRGMICEKSRLTLETRLRLDRMASEHTASYDLTAWRHKTPPAPLLPQSEGALSSALAQARSELKTASAQIVSLHHTRNDLEDRVTELLRERQEDQERLKTIMAWLETLKGAVQMETSSARAKWSLAAAHSEESARVLQVMHDRVRKDVMSSALSLVRKIRHSALVHTFDTWEVHWKDKRQIRSNTIKMLRICRCSALVRAFDKLKACFQAQRQIRTKTIQILRRRIRHTLARAVLSWHAACCSSSPPGAEPHILAQRMERKRLLAAFGGWGYEVNCFGLQGIEQRSTRTLAAVRYARTRCLSKALGVMQRYLARRRQVAASACKLVHHMMFVCVCVCVCVRVCVCVCVHAKKASMYTRMCFCVCVKKKKQIDGRKGSCARSARCFFQKIEAMLHVESGP